MAPSSERGGCTINESLRDGRYDSPRDIVVSGFEVSLMQMRLIILRIHDQYVRLYHHVPLLIHVHPMLPS